MIDFHEGGLSAEALQTTVAQQLRDYNGLWDSSTLPPGILEKFSLVHISSSHLDTDNPRWKLIGQGIFSSNQLTKLELLLTL